VSTYLQPNVVSDFRNRRSYEYFSNYYNDKVEGLKILPLATAELRAVLRENISYDKLYSLFEEAYRSNTRTSAWYKREIAEKISID
jgi:hypothetical protein